MSLCPPSEEGAPRKHSSRVVLAFPIAVHFLGPEDLSHGASNLNAFPQSAILLLRGMARRHGYKVDRQYLRGFHSMKMGFREQCENMVKLVEHVSWTFVIYKS